VDREVVVAQTGGSTLITSRDPDDLPAFCAAVVDAVAG
jgi:protease I